MATVIFGDFEWDAEKASTNRRKHSVSFEEAAEAMRDPHSVDFDDIAHPENTVTLAMSPVIASCMLSPPSEESACASSALARQRAMSDTSTKMSPEPIEPSTESLEEMPAIDPSTHRRRPGRGHHAHLRGGELVAVDPDLWPYFKSSEAVNAALRGLVEAAKHIRRTGS